MRACVSGARLLRSSPRRSSRPARALDRSRSRVVSSRSFRPRSSLAEMDPHHVLGVPPGASEAEIKAAYRRAALRWHPDRNAASDAAASATAATRFREASEAFERLTSAAGPDARAPRERRPRARLRRPPRGDSARLVGRLGVLQRRGRPFGFEPPSPRAWATTCAASPKHPRFVRLLAALGARSTSPRTRPARGAGKARRRSEAGRAPWAPPRRSGSWTGATHARAGSLYGSGGGGGVGGSGSADAYINDVATTRRRRRFEDAESAHDATPTNHHPDEATRYAYAYDGGFLDADAVEAFASSSSSVDGARPAAASDARRSGIPSNEGFAASPLSAAARRRAVRSSSRALPVAEGGGARYRSGRGGGGGDERDAAVRSRGGNTAGGTDTARQDGGGPLGRPAGSRGGGCASGAPRITRTV